MTATGTIIPIKRETNRDFRNEKLTDIWVTLSPGRMANTDYQYLVNGALQECLKKMLDDVRQDDVVAFYTEQFDCTIIAETIRRAAEKASIYILTNDDPSEKLGFLDGFSLVRFGVHSAGTFLLVNPMSDKPKGILLCSPCITENIESPSSLGIELSPNQVKQLFRLFCQLFWIEAQHEILDGVRKTGDSPLDFMPPIADLSVKCILLEKWRKSRNTAEAMVLPDPMDKVFELEESANPTQCRLLVSSERMNLFNSVPKNVGTRAICQTTIPYRLLIAESGSLLIPTDKGADDAHLYGILLEKEQTKEFRRYFSTLFDNAEFELHRSISRESLKSRNAHFYDIAKQNSIISKNKLNHIDRNLGIVESNDWKSYHELVKVEPDDFPKPDYAVSCKYEWSVVQYSGDRGVSRDPLYSEWEKACSSFSQSLENAMGKIQSLEEMKAKMKPDIIARLQRFILGKDSKLQDLSENIKRLRNTELNGRHSIESWKDKIKEINEIISQINSTELEYVNRKRKAAFEIEIEKKKKALENEMTKLQGDLERKRVERHDEREKLSKSQQRLMDLSDSYYSSCNVKSGEEKKWMEKCEGLRRRLNDKKSSLSKDDRKTAEEFLKFIDEEEGINKIIAYIHSNISAIEFQVKDLQDKIDKRNKSIELLSKESYSDDATTGSSALGKLLEPARSEDDLSDPIEELSLKLPKESLPSVGVLYSKGYRRFLAIDKWEEESEAKTESYRLNASLCARVEV